MKIAVGIFLLFYFLGFAVGYSVGKNDVITNGDFLRYKAFEPVTLLIRPASDRVPSSIELVYDQQGRILYRFNVETNQLTKTNVLAGLLLSQEYRRNIGISIDGKVALTFLGGSTGGFLLKDIFTQTDPAKRRNTVAAILGAISGYSLGYECGAGLQPSPTSKEVAAILDDPKEWVAYKRAYLRKTLSRTLQIAPMAADPEKTKEFEELASAEYAFVLNEKNVNAIDFITAARVLNEAAAAAKANLKTVAASDDADSNLDWWWASAAVLASAIGFLLFLSADELKSLCRRFLENAPAETSEVARSHLSERQEIEEPASGSNGRSD